MTVFFYVISHYCTYYLLFTFFFVYSTHWTVGYRKDLKFRFFSIFVPLHITQVPQQNYHQNRTRPTPNCRQQFWKKDVHRDLKLQSVVSPYTYSRIFISYTVSILSRFSVNFNYLYTYRYYTYIIRISLIAPCSTFATLITV